MAYQDWKASVLGRVIGDGECVSLVVNNSAAYVEHLFPGISWTSIIAPVTGAKDIGKSSMYLTWIPNDHNNVNQLPKQGDIMVFGATPAAGYSNTYNNPYGHTGVCESANSSGYALLQQNAPAYRQAANITNYAWSFRPCLGWLTPAAGAPASPAPTPPPATQKVFLPAVAGPWHAYVPGSSYNPNDRTAVRGILRPDLFPPGLTYDIKGWIADNAVVIDTQYFGRCVIWVKGTIAQIK